MRDVMQVRAASVRLAAVKGGWRRDPVARKRPDGSGPWVVWHGPDGQFVECLDPEMMPGGERHAARASLIELFSGACRLCGAQGHAVAEDDVRSLDRGRVRLVVTHGVVGVLDRPVFGIEGWFAVEHAADCPARPELDGLTGAGG